MVNLSNRLETIARLVPPGSRLADIGSDHALLPVFLVQQGTVPFAVAGEVNLGPLQAAEKQVREADLTDRIRVRKGDGLTVVEPGEVDVVTIAGMGGGLIVKILSGGPDKLEGVKRLILQPNVAEELVRAYLVEHGWYLEHEEILEEDGKIYEVLSAVRREDADVLNAELYRERELSPRVVASRDLLMKMGPHLIACGGPVFLEKWEGELEKTEKIIRQLHGSETEAAREKRDALQREMNAVKEVLACLPKDKPSYS